MNNQKNNSGQIILKITNVDNAAFVDNGLDIEVSWIIDIAASKIEWIDDITDIAFMLRDANGNNVGHIGYTPLDTRVAVNDEPMDDPEAVISLSIELGNAAFDDGAGAEIARILREVAGKVRDGTRYFGMYDKNGNNIGVFEWNSADKA